MSFLASFLAGGALPFYYPAYFAISSFYFLLTLGSFSKAYSSASNYSPASFFNRALYFFLALLAFSALPGSLSSQLF